MRVHAAPLFLAMKKGSPEGSLLAFYAKRY